MDGFLVIMAAFAGLGLVDDLTGGHMGLAKEFERGLATMGRVALSVVGIYCIGITAIQRNADAIAAVAAHLPFDPSLIIGCLLCADSGGLPIAQRLASTPAMGIFTGALVGGGLGTTVGYQMPLFLSALPREHLPTIMRGFIYGLVTLPAGLLAGGLLLGLSLGELLTTMVPVLALCLALVVCSLRLPDGTVAFLTRFGMGVTALTYGLFALVAAGLFIPSLALADRQLVEEVLYIILRATIIASGGLVFSELAVRYCQRPLRLLTGLLGVNDASVIGLLLNCTHSVAMLALFPRMDAKGRILNAAFAVSGAYILGGQLAFVSQILPADSMPAYLVNKLLSGLLAVALAGWVESRRAKAISPPVPEKKRDTAKKR